MLRIILRFIIAFVSTLLLIYLVWPYSPDSIESFSSLPNSTRSTLSGDTVQVPNLKAYYSDHYRNNVLKYYKKQYQLLHRFPFPPLRLNHPPEYAYQVIKDQTQSTYLEEFTYPLRDSIYINGLEPFDEATKQTRYSAAVPFEQDNQTYETKVTMRYYSSSLVSRVLVWIGINISGYLIWEMVRRIKKYG